MLDFTNLRAESYAAFILAIVFTIITIAGAIVILRRRFKTSMLIKVLTTIVFPFVAIFCWLYMILNTTANFDIITSLYSSFLITLGFFGIVVAVYFITLAIIKKKKEKDLAYMKSLETEVEDLEKTLNEKEQENAQNNENDVNEIVIANDVIENSEENNKEETVNPTNVEKQEVENQEVEQAEEVEENKTEEAKENAKEQNETKEEYIEVNEPENDEIIVPNEEDSSIEQEENNDESKTDETPNNGENN